MMASVDLDGNRGSSETEGLCNVGTCEVDLLILRKFNEIHAEWELLLGEGEDESFFPGEVVALRGGFAVALLVVVGESAVDLVLLGEVPQLGLPQSHD